MVRDLAMPIEIIGGKLIREETGLALSSRNRYLSPADKQRGLSLSRSLREIKRLYVEENIQDCSQLKTRALKLLTVDQLDYLEIVDCDSLQPLEKITKKARALVAAKIGNTRLIDNMEISK